MPRQARLDAPETLHHVMIRGIERSPIFRDDQDRKDFISRMGMLAQESGTKIVAWALMSNHVHLLFFSGPGGISEIIREAEKKVRRYLRVGEMNNSIDKSIKEICLREGVLEQELRMGVRTRKYSGVRAKTAYHLSYEFGISRAEIAR